MWQKYKNEVTKTLLQPNRQRHLEMVMIFGLNKDEVKRPKSVKNRQNTFKKVKNQPKKDNFGVPPQGVDQLLHVDQL